MQLKYFVLLPAVDGYFDPPYFTESLLATYVMAFQFKVMENCTPALLAPRLA